MTTVWAWSVGGMILTVKNWSSRKEMCPGATLYTTKPMWTGLGLTSDFRG